jgi:hypothetical protein
LENGYSLVSRKPRIKSVTPYENSRKGGAKGKRRRASPEAKSHSNKHQAVAQVAQSMAKARSARYWTIQILFDVLETQRSLSVLFSRISRFRPLVEETPSFIRVEWAIHQSVEISSTKTNSNHHKAIMTPLHILQPSWIHHRCVEVINLPQQLLLNQLRFLLHHLAF